MLAPRLLLLASALVGCHASRPSPTTTAASAAAPAVAPAVAPTLDARRFLCARIGAATEDATPIELDVADQAAEGGLGEARVEGDLVSVTVRLAGETFHQRLELRFRGDELVCSRGDTTSVGAMYARSASNPEGVPPYWRFDVRYFAGGEEIGKTTDATHGAPDDTGRTPLELAADIRGRVPAPPAAK